MAPSRRGVRFSHRHQQANGQMSGMNEQEDNPKTAGPDDEVQGPPSPAQQKADYEKKKANFMTRTFWTLIMIAGFFSALFMGHIYLILVVTAVQVVSFREVVDISNFWSRVRQLRTAKGLSWYWLSTTLYFLYGESVIHYFKHVVLVDTVLLPLATHHRFISFLLYVFGFVYFVASLQAGQYNFQLTQFAWTHMALILIVVQAHFIINNIFEGLIWFFLPAALVITNDIWAYICGITFGRTQLIKLSPKKTVEGFLGAWVMTIIFGMIFTKLLKRWGYFICPAMDLGANVLSDVQCVPNPVFISQTFSLPRYFFLPEDVDISITMAPIYLHTLALATFASLIAPFGGFFASGVKRSLQIKDWADSIPGHGGMTDRMDCQFITGFFAYLYYQTFIAVRTTSVGAVLELVMTGLSQKDQIQFFRTLGQYFRNQGLETEELCAMLRRSLNDEL